MAAALAAAADPTPVIVRFALDDAAPCPLCVATVELFVGILGAEAGNLALKVLATGGVYLGGGIPPRILPQLRHPRFLAAFCEKGRFRELLGAVPVSRDPEPEGGPARRRVVRIGIVCLLYL